MTHFSLFDPHRRYTINITEEVLKKHRCGSVLQRAYIVKSLQPFSPVMGITPFQNS